MENDDFALPDRSFCDGIKNQYGLQMPVLHDANGDFARIMQLSSPRHWHFVFSEGNNITFRMQNAPADARFEAEVEALLP